MTLIIEEVTGNSKKKHDHRAVKSPPSPCQILGLRFVVHIASACPAKGAFNFVCGVSEDPSCYVLKSECMSWEMTANHASSAHRRFLNRHVTSTSFWIRSIELPVLRCRTHLVKEGGDDDAALADVVDSHVADFKR